MAADEGGNGKGASAPTGIVEASASAPRIGEADVAVAGFIALQPEPSPEESETLPEDERVRAAVELLRPEPTMSSSGGIVNLVIGTP